MGVSNTIYSTAAAFVARLALLGVTDVVVSPGYRSVLLTLCFDVHPLLKTWVHIDERSAGFFALGLSRATGRPTVLVCTSGTAAANYLPAVVEAGNAGIPLIVCTADRPPEMRGWGSHQTINQVGLYGTAVKLAVDLPVLDEVTESDAVCWADRAIESATGLDPGPVHINWPIRKPFEPQGAIPVNPSVSLETGKPAIRQDTGIDDDSLEAALKNLTELVTAHERGLVVVGAWPGGGLKQERLWAKEVLHFATWAGWPVIGEPLSGMRRFAASDSDDSDCSGVDELSDVDDLNDITGSCVVTTASHLLVDETFADSMRPDVVVLVGRTFAMTPTRLWIERVEPQHVVLIDPENRWETAVLRITSHVPASVEALRSLDAGGPRVGGLDMGNRRVSGCWLRTWQTANSKARHELAQMITSGPLLSAQIVHTLVEALPDQAVLMSSNSMPIRDMDAYASHTGSLFCTANQGVSGIDGVVSTALGLAASDPTRVTTLHVGDLALLHDLASLTAAVRLDLRLIVVCVDNGGGEIFSTLPIADCVDSDRFERLLRTPHEVCFDDLNGFGGIRTYNVSDQEELSRTLAHAVASTAPGVHLILAEIDIDADLVQRQAIGDALRSTLHIGL